MNELYEKYIDLGVPKYLLDKPPAEKESIIGVDKINSYFKKVIDYNNIPMTDIYLQSDDLKFCSIISLMMFKGFLVRGINCRYQTTITLPVKCRDYDFMDTLMEVKILFLTEVGHESSTDFNKSRDLILQIVSRRRELGLNTIFVSDLTLEEVVSFYGKHFVNILFQNISFIKVSEK